MGSVSEFHETYCSNSRLTCCFLILKGSGLSPVSRCDYHERAKSRRPCRVGSVGSVSASRTVGREFASRLGHTKDHHKNGTNCLPA